MNSAELSQISIDDPNFQAWLEAQGYQISQSDDGLIVMAPGGEQRMPRSYDYSQEIYQYSLTLQPSNSIDTQDGTQFGTTNDTVNWFNQKYGTHFTDRNQYLIYIYGNLGHFDPSGRYYILPTGYTKENGLTVNPPLDYNPPDDLGTRLVRAGLMAVVAYAAGGAVMDALSAGASPEAVINVAATDAAESGGTLMLDAAGTGTVPYVGATVLPDLATVKDIASVVQEAAPSPDVSLPTEATPAETAAHVANTAPDYTYTIPEALPTGSDVIDPWAAEGATSALPSAESAALPDLSLPSYATAAETAAHAIQQAAPAATNAGSSFFQTLTKALPVFTAVTSGGAALYKALNPLSPSGLSPSGRLLTPAQRSMLSPAQQAAYLNSLTPEQQAQQDQLDAATQAAQNKNVGLLLGIAAIVGILLVKEPSRKRDQKSSKGKGHATRTR